MYYVGVVVIVVALLSLTYLSIRDYLKVKYELGIVDVRTSRELKYPGYERLKISFRKRPGTDPTAIIPGEFVSLPHDFEETTVMVWVFKKGSNKALYSVSSELVAKGGGSIHSAHLVKNPKYLGEEVYRDGV